MIEAMIWLHRTMMDVEAAARASHVNRFKTDCKVALLLLLLLLVKVQCSTTVIIMKTCTGPFDHENQSRKGFLKPPAVTNYNRNIYHRL